ncbi:hypothetical protein NFI96_014118 [Prochilodus magdalenae]|nr:hypothetical protein NFI96_014118 [Prochilodus magdalenae]
MRLSSLNWGLALLLAVVEPVTSGSGTSQKRGPGERRKKVHRVQHGQCSYTFILPEMDSCKGGSAHYGGSNVVQRDAPPGEEWSVQKLQHLETAMENNTQWLQKVYVCVCGCSLLWGLESWRSAVSGRPRGVTWRMDEWLTAQDYCSGVVPDCHGVTQNGSGSSSVTSPALVLVETPNESVCGGTVVSTKRSGLLSHVHRTDLLTCSDRLKAPKKTLEDCSRRCSQSGIIYECLGRMAAYVFVRKAPDLLGMGSEKKQGMLNHLLRLNFGGCEGVRLENYIQDNIKSEMVHFQANAVHNQTATMLEIGTNLLTQTAEQTRKLNVVEAKVMNQTSRLEIQLLQHSLSTNKLEKELLMQTSEISRLRDKNRYERWAGLPGTSTGPLFGQCLSSCRLETKVLVLETQQRTELEDMKEEKERLRDLVGRQSAAITALERQLRAASSNNSALQRQQQQLMKSVHALINLVSPGTVSDSMPGERRFRDCAEIYNSGHNSSGVYDIYLGDMTEPTKLVVKLLTRQDGTRRDETRRDETRRDETRREQDRQDKTRQDKTRQDGTGEDGTGRDNTIQDEMGRDGTRQDGTRQDETREDETREDETREDRTDRTRQDGTGRDETRQDETREDRTDRIRQDRTRRDRTGQDRTGQDRTGQDKTRQDKRGQDRQAKTGQDKTRQDGTGQDRLGQDRTGRDGTRQDGTGQDRMGQDRTRRERTGQTGQDKTRQDKMGRDNTRRDGWTSKMGVSNRVDSEWTQCAKRSSRVSAKFIECFAAEVFCDMETSGGGWTVFQRRINGSIDFQRGWKEYKMGFGDPGGEHWLGNEAVHLITSQAQYSLRVELRDWEGNAPYSLYEKFQLATEKQQYRLLLRGYSGTAGQQSSLASHGTSFSTRDSDNDNCLCKCALMLTGGWWFDACGLSNLNGMYYTLGQNIRKLNGIKWHHFRGPSYSLKSTAMMIRPADF